MNHRPIIIKPDKRFKKGNISVKGREVRGHPESVKIEPIKAPPTYFNPPHIVSRELAKKLKGLL